MQLCASHLRLVSQPKTRCQTDESHLSSSKTKLTGNLAAISCGFLCDLYHWGEQVRRHKKSVFLHHSMCFVFIADNRRPLEWGQRTLILCAGQAFLRSRVWSIHTPRAGRAGVVMHRSGQCILALTNINSQRQVDIRATR